MIQSLPPCDQDTEAQKERKSHASRDIYGCWSFREEFQILSKGEWRARVIILWAEMLQSITEMVGYTRNGEPESQYIHNVLLEESDQQTFMEAEVRQQTRSSPCEVTRHGIINPFR
ncbi:hypothetical protein XENOCAPTIV_024242 [Xenoophorus captivus]|uniref:Uncharacterized protein n=1 Tax=Xenoophorus captivus TaxID=1517983 RepID=A0ABV0RSX0_9TELE